MEKCFRSRVANLFNEYVANRKAMFIPVLCVCTFMLVGYAAIDSEAPEIISERISLPYGEEFNPDAIIITDNQSSRENITVKADIASLQTDQLGMYTVSVTAIDEFNNETTKDVYIDIVDKKGPVIEVQGASEGYVIQVPVNGSEDITSYVKAIDDVDGDVTPFIEANKELKTDKISNHSITLKVSDSSNNVTEKTYDFVVADFTAPEIKLVDGENPVINYGDEFKLEDVATVSDNFDKKVETTVEGTVDTKKLDEKQEITIKAVDSSGNETTKKINIIVEDIEEPTISLSSTSVEIDMGDSFNALKYVSSANDNLDGDLTDNVSASSISTSSAGKKTVTYTVTDEAGNKATKTLTVTVVDPSASAYGSDVVSIAMSKLGFSYVYGSSGPYSFDCSGLTSWTFKQVGISLPRTSAAQATGGTYVSRSSLQAGDLVFYSYGGPISHVAIYIGGGQIVHALNESTGVVVTSVDIMPYVTARRY